MKQLLLTIRDINGLNLIKAQLLNEQPLSSEQQTYLADFLSQLPSNENLISNNIPLDSPLPVDIWDAEKLEKCLEQWLKLFESIPSYDGSTFCIKGYLNEPELMSIRTLIVILFVPTLANAISLAKGAQDKERFEAHLKDDGTAIFQLPTLEDAEEYPELYSFNGTWKEAYLLLIETLQKGWPMEEFPEELQKFLPKQ